MGNISNYHKAFMLWFVIIDAFMLGFTFVLTVLNYFSYDSIYPALIMLFFLSLFIYSLLENWSRLETVLLNGENINDS